MHKFYANATPFYKMNLDFGNCRASLGNFPCGYKKDSSTNDSNTAKPPHMQVFDNVSSPHNVRDASVTWQWGAYYSQLTGSRTEIRWNS